MDFLKLAKKRYSCRNYQDRQVEQEKLDSILEAALIAPSGCNKQPYKILVVKEKEGLDKISKSTNLFGAPLAILVCADKLNAWVRPYDGKNIAEIDASIVTDHMMLEAADLGLDSVWICSLKPDILKEEFHIPDNLEVVNILAIGYGAQEPANPDRHSQVRKAINEITIFETF